MSQDLGFTGSIVDVDINKEMRDAYLQYSMSVIVGRALPDVRDGLKPVHRRILFAQYEMGNTYDKPYKKSARVVGDVIGKYHPHGDSAVYDTMVRMAQDFSMRYPLEDGQGNFGSIDGDSPAAMRYTEIRMTRLAETLLEDIEKETVPFGPNYDDSLKVPLVLPAKFPNLLVNGSSGIAVGMATNIPPHNLSEVIDAVVLVLEDPDVSVHDIMKKLPGPDFPTAGIISGGKGLIEAYATGKGIITVKAKAEISRLRDGREEIVISEIPYQVNKARLIESIAELVNEKKIEGISDIRDESSREGMRIVIQVKRGENSSVILNRLYKFTQMQVSYSIILLALDQNNQPVTFSLKDLIQSFIDHRIDVVTKRSLFELKKAQERQHILLGLQKALNHIDEVVSTIKNSQDAKEAETKLIERFDFTIPQVKSILEMRLQRLTGLERDKLEQERRDLHSLIERLQEILNDKVKLKKVVKEELLEIKQKFGDGRRTKIEESEANLDDEDLISDDPMVVVITNTGYIKRIPTHEYRTQKRGGRGLKGMDTLEEDYVVDVFTATNKTSLLIFTDIGKVYTGKVYQLPLGSRTSKGRSIANVIKISSQEKIMAILPVHFGTEGKYVVMVTKRGIIKKTDTEEFKNIRGSGIIALTVDLNDTLIDAKLSSGEDDILLTTALGMSIRFHESEVRAMGRSARGVRGIDLSDDDRVVSLEVIRKGRDGTFLTVTEKGFGKRSELSDYRVQGRGGSGIITQGNIEKVGSVVGGRLITDKHEIILTTDTGQMIRIVSKDISVLGRNTQGVKLISLADNERVTSFTVVDTKDEDD